MSIAPNQPPPSSSEQLALGPAADLAFAPLHKRAFGTAVGAAVGLAVFLVTAARLTLGPEGRTDLILLAQYFHGYAETWTGALVGLGWGFVTGFVAGWFFAFSRNLTITTWIFLTRARAELAATRDFLDHI